MTATRTKTQARTFTEARAREVMRQVHGDFMSLSSAGIINRETAQQWFDELQYAVLSDVVEAFEIQLRKPDGTRIGLIYTVYDDGNALEGAQSGGVDPYGLPKETKMSLYVTYRGDAPALEDVRAFLRKRGWTPGGTALDGNAARDRVYSKDGFGVVRSKVGEWE